MTGPNINSRIPQREFFEQDVQRVATGLLGMHLVSTTDGELTAGRIVETEAYLPEGDPACHAARGKTPGNSSMFGPAGTGYVYPIHARVCFNVVAQKTGQGTAVLIRAVQPLSGIETMMRRRSIPDPRDLCRGPARLCQALGIDRSMDGHDLTAGRQLWIERVDAGAESSDTIRVTERIGVTSARELKLRFVIADSRYVSGPKRLR